MCPTTSCATAESSLHDSEPGKDWFSLFVAGNETAFNRVYTEYKAAIYFFSRKKLHNDIDAQDVTSGTFYRLWNARASIQSLRHIRHFLFFAARNAAIDLLKGRQTRAAFKLQADSREGGITAENYLERMIATERMEEIFTEVQGLTERRREVFLLIYSHQKTPAEVAEMTGLGLPTIYSHLRNACESLRTRLLQKGFDRR